MSSFVFRELSPREVFLFYLFAVGVFIFPLIQVDSLYYDDNQRALLLIKDNWRHEGRILIELMYRFFSFTSVTPNMFPLGYVFALPLAALVMRALTTHYGLRFRFLDCLVVLPFFYSPFSLSIFVYQYDGPAVMIGFCAIAYSVVYGGGWRAKELLIPILLIAAGLAIHQLTLNVLLGLYCIEVADNISRGASLESVLRTIARRSVQLWMALLIYAITVFPLMSDERTPLLAFDRYWFGNVVDRFSEVLEKVGLLVNTGNQWICAAFVTCAAFGYLMVVPRLVADDRPVRQKLLLLGIYGLAPPLLLMTIPGFTVLLLYFDPAARVLLGLASVLMGLMFFFYKFLRQMDDRALCLLVLPVLCMLSFSFMFGRVLLTQKELEDSVLYSLAYDLNSSAGLWQLKDIYLVQPEQARQWLPASAGVLSEIPALNYVLNRNRLFISEQFPRAGINNVSALSNVVFAQLPGKQLVISSRFYDIYQAGGSGYIQMKNAASAEDETRTSTLERGW